MPLSFCRNAYIGDKMKKIGLILNVAVLLIIIGCLNTPKPDINRGYTGESTASFQENIPIRISFAEEDLSLHEPYISFLDYESSKWQIHIIITTVKPLNDFQWIGIERDWDNYEIIGVFERASLKNFTETQSIIASFSVPGITFVAYPTQGISFIDEYDIRRYFTVTIGNYGMDADEYDGPYIELKEITPSPTDIGELIITAVKALQQSDEKAIKQLIHPDLGVILFARPGAYETVEIKNTISLSDPPSGYVSMPFREPEIDDYRVKWENLPVYDCDDWKWNKPSGIYADKIENRWSPVLIANNLSKSFDKPFTADFMQKLKDYENNYLHHYSVIVIGDVECYWNYLDFTITLIDGSWYLTVINMAAVCA